MVICDVDRDCTYSQTDFSKSIFLIQVHDLLPTNLNHANAEKIRQQVGNVLDIDIRATGSLRWVRLPHI